MRAGIIAFILGCLSLPAATITNIVYITNYDACIVETSPGTPDLGNRLGVTSIQYNNHFQGTPLRSITFHGTNFTDYLLFRQGYVTNILFPELLTQTTHAAPNAGEISIGIFLCTNLQSIVASLLTITRNVDFSRNISLTNIDLSALKLIWAFNANSNTALTTLSLPALTNSLVSLSANSCTALTSVTLSAYLPTNTCTIMFTNCAMSAASVNHILARCVASSTYASGILNLSGGTSAAPTGQGVTDKSTLIARGVTVTTN